MVAAALSPPPFPGPGAVSRARRRLATVVVEGLELPGMRLAEHLVGLRVGTLVLRDDRPVSLRDAGFRSFDAGRPRAEAAAEVLSVQAEETSVVEAPAESSICGADLHILAFRQEVPDIALHRGFEESPAVLPVLVTPAGWRVGPLLLEDSLTCSRCVGVGRLAEHGPMGPDAAPGLQEEAAAAVAAQQVAVLIDGAAPAAVEQAGLLADARTGGIAPVRTLPDQRCVCPGAASGSLEGSVGL